MIIRSILTIAVLASFVFGAAANANPRQPAPSLTAQIDGITASGGISGLAPRGTPRGN
ncbi:MAG: hypothetical protein JKY00_03795 [Roseicyclus sp.]|nr:hypothetical protein [Roseicyclus sp.]